MNLYKDTDISSLCTHDTSLLFSLKFYILKVYTMQIKYFAEITRKREISCRCNFGFWRYNLNFL